MKISFKAIGHIMAMACLVINLSSFTAKDETLTNCDPVISHSQANKCLNPLSLTYKTDTLFPNSQLESSVIVGIKNCPFPASDVFTTIGDKTTWDLNNIEKCTFVSTTALGYFIRSAGDGMKTLVIYYNPAEQKEVKMVINSSRIDNNNVRYLYQSVDGLTYFDISVKDNSIGYNVNVGSALDLTPLGKNLVKQTNQSTTGGGSPCSRTSGFRDCIVCSARECYETWWCVIACGGLLSTCVAAWVTACGILQI